MRQTVVALLGSAATFAYVIHLGGWEAAGVILAINATSLVAQHLVKP